MNRRELVLAIAERSELDRKTVDAVLAEFTQVVTETVAKGDPVSLPGFCKFARVDTKARMGRNPATGEPIKIPAKRKARITPLKAFKDAVISGKVPKQAPAKKAAAKKATAKKATAKKAPAKRVVKKR
jgi:DNA-binding protein HU-beta